MKQKKVKSTYSPNLSGDGKITKKNFRNYLNKMKKESKRERPLGHENFN